MSTNLQEWLAGQAAGLGFDGVGVCAPEPAPRSVQAFRGWLAAGMHGDMAYMARPDRLERTIDVRRTLRDARSAVVVGRSYAATALDESLFADRARGRIAAYAWGDDYHDVMLPRLRALAGRLSLRVGSPVAAWAGVDAGPFLERDAAARAGLGFVGRNTMLIRPGPGSWCFLGVLLLDLTLAADAPDERGTCGSCRRCLEACPTGAFPQPYVLDARRCISYLTIEHRGPVPPELRPLMGNWVFGCDVCNTVCPYNAPTRRGTGGSAGGGGPRPRSPGPGVGPPPAGPGPPAPLDVARMAPLLADLVALDEADMGRRFAGSPVLRARRGGLVRNACIALGNWGTAAAVAPLTAALLDRDPLVRGHAAWALGRVRAPGARAALERARAVETEPWVADEIRAAGR